MLGAREKATCPWLDSNTRLNFLKPGFPISLPYSQGLEPLRLYPSPLPTRWFPLLPSSNVMLNFVFSYWLLPSLPPHSFNLINMWSVLGSWTKPSITANSALLSRCSSYQWVPDFSASKNVFFKLPFSGFHFKNLLIATSCVECWWFFFSWRGRQYRIPTADTNQIYLT